jgi:hypothetical protein
MASVPTVVRGKIFNDTLCELKYSKYDLIEKKLNFYFNRSISQFYNKISK